MLAFRVTLLALLSIVVACHRESPTEPSHVNPRLTTTCVPSGGQVSCSATLWDVPTYGATNNVTADAIWIASDPSIGTFTAPGVFVPSRVGEVSIWAHYQRWDSPQSSFLVDPAHEAQRLYWLSGLVLDASTQAPIQGAEVRILDGYSQGARAVSNAFGSYQIDGILTGQPFSVAASASGYASQTRSYRVDSPVGGQNGPFLDFHLQRIQ